MAACMLCLCFASVLGITPTAASVDRCPDPLSWVDAAIASVCRGEAEAIVLTAVRVAGPLEHPWSIAFLPDGRILVTERPGRLRLIDGGELHIEPIHGIPPVRVGGHAGLFDVVLDPTFATNQILYLSYVHGTEKAASIRVMRARFDGMTLVEPEVIFESRPPAPALLHLGGRLAFGPDGLLYLTLGDRAEAHRAQDLLDHAGSLVRIHPDGRVPADNPFVETPDALPEIFSYGHRNPQGLASTPQGGRLWSHEHGPRGGDELNVIEAGRNYGWPLATHGVDYDGTPIGIGPYAPGVTPPIHGWTPAVAPSGMAFYEGERMPLSWRGSLLIGTLAGQALLRLELADDAVVQEERHLVHEIGRIRDVRVGPDGYVYLVTDEPNGALYRLEPVSFPCGFDASE